MVKKSLEQFQRDIARVFASGMHKGSKRSSTPKFRAEHTFSHETTENYASVARDFGNFVYQSHGVTDLRFVKSEHGQAFIERQLERFQSGEISAGTVKTYIHSLAKLQSMAREQMGARIRVINKDEMLTRAKEVDAVRRIEDAHKGRIISRVEAEQMVDRLAGSHSPNALVISELARFALETGARITAGLRFQVQHIDFDRNAVTFEGDKGGKTRTVVQVDPSYMRHLQTLADGRTPGRQVFEILRQDGNLHNLDGARHTIENLYARHAEKLGFDGANFHSQRKAFANVRYATYRGLNYKALERELSERMKVSPQLADKMKNIESRMGAHHGAGRHLSHDQIAKLLVSIDLGHERLDVLRFYLESDEED